MARTGCCRSNGLTGQPYAERVDAAARAVDPIWMPATADARTRMAMVRLVYNQPEMIEFRVLGPLEAAPEAGRPLRLGGPRQRALLVPRACARRAPDKAKG